MTKNLLLLLFYVLFCAPLFGQDLPITPGGSLEKIYDTYGNPYSFEDIMVDRPVKPGGPPVMIACSTNSYFNFFFEQGSGMEDDSNSTHLARRAVLCQVFRDLTGFINSPLATTNQKVNIWVRRINNVIANPNNVLGVASSFYVLPGNATAGTGGIADNEMWKTIHTGVDSFTNTTIPLTPIGQVGNQSGQFFHGLVAFNFNTDNTIPITWHTNLTQNAAAGSYDLYSAVLHEVAHALGISSNIDQNGGSKFGPSFPYFTRYDSLLRTNNNLPLLTTGGSCSLYNYGFNSSLNTSVLHPAPGNCVNTVSCANSIKFMGGSVTIPVHTPNCWSQLSSLHHFEDQLFPTCASPYGDNQYFLMCNSVDTGVTRRYLKPEERLALCDLGYSVNTSYGASNTANGSYTGTYNYVGTSVCPGIAVGGVNDGISGGQYTFSGNTGANITLSGILSNDVNATGYECLEDLTAAATISPTAGSGPITFSSAVGGIHLLRYVPVNGGQKGNITYIFVRVIPTVTPDSCTPAATACNLVTNGNFEQHNQLPSTLGQIGRACGWFKAGAGTPDYLFANSMSYTNVPCNALGFENDNVPGNNGYAGVFFNQVSPTYAPCEMFGTRLTSALAANTNYQIKLDISQGEFYRYRNAKIQAFLTSIPPDQITGNVIPDVSNGILLNSNNFISNTNGWQTITINFTTGTNVAGMEYLYLGGLNTVQFENGAQPIAVSGCNQPQVTSSQVVAYYYIDNVSLMPIYGAAFDLPSTVCAPTNLGNLTTYLSAVVTTGVFSGPGVSLSGGVYSFNPGVAGAGTHTISYTYNNSLGCPITLTDTITVTPATVPGFVKVGPRCAGIRYAGLPTTSTNGITGSWSLQSSNPPAYTYLFTPNTGQCATTTTMTVYVYPNVPVDAVNDNYTSSPISQDTGGVTPSVFTNDWYDSALLNGTTMQNVTVSIISSPIAGVTIDASGVITIPANAPIGTYTITYQLSLLGCTTSDTATATVFIDKPFTTTPVLSGSIRANNQVNTIDFQSGKAIISGYFTTYNNIAANRIARLNTDLTLDTSFLATGATPSGMPRDVAVQPNNKVIVVGGFAGFNGGSNGYGLARLNFDGSVDTTFNSGGSGFSSSSSPETCTLQTDGKILIGGHLITTYNGLACTKVVRLNYDGTVDPTFTFPALSYGSVRKILVQTDGKILVLGHFLDPMFSPAANVQLFRVNANGTFDSSFTPSVMVSTGSVNCGNCFAGFAPTNMLLQPDGKIIVVGAFSSYNGLSRTNIVRLTATGAVDMSFNASAATDRAILEVILEPMSNKLLLGGEFTSFSGTPVSKMIRLTTSGQLDTSFNIGSGTLDSSGSTNTHNNIVALKKQADGKVIVAGKFTSFNGVTAGNITRIFGDSGLQSRGMEMWRSEPEIDISHSDANVKVYPNPSRDVFYIDLGEKATQHTDITVYNILGSAIYHAQWTNGQINAVDLSGLPTGYYIARIAGGQNIEVKLLKN